jgi:hypothetical protein
MGVVPQSLEPKPAFCALAQEVGKPRPSVPLARGRLALSSVM